MHSLAGLRVSSSPVRLNGIQTHSKMHFPAGWRVSCAPLGACLLSRPEVRLDILVAELGASVPVVGNHSTQVAGVSCVHPLETRVQRVAIMWFNSDWVSTHRRRNDRYCTQLTQRIVAVFKQGLHSVEIF